MPATGLLSLLVVCTWHLLCGHTKTFEFQLRLSRSAVNRCGLGWCENANEFLENVLTGPECALFSWFRW